MNKREYLEKLQEYLSFELPERLVYKNIRYYSDYFDEQVRQGKTAAAVSEELGDPQLIARSCIDAEKAGADGIPNSPDDIDFSEEMEREKAGRASGASRTQGAYSGESTAQGTSESASEGTGAGMRPVSTSGCLIGLLIFAAIIALVLAFLFSGPGLLIISAVAVASLIGWVIRKLIGS